MDEEFDLAGLLANQQATDGGVYLTDPGSYSGPNLSGLYDYLESPLGVNWGGFDASTADYLRETQPALMATPGAIEWDANASGQSDLYNTVMEQVYSGQISADEGRNMLSGLTSDGQVYTSSSPEQNRALAAQNAAVPSAIRAAQSASSGSGLTTKNALGALSSLAKLGISAATIAKMLQPNSATRVQLPTNQSTNFAVQPTKWAMPTRTLASTRQANGGSPLSMIRR